MSLGHTEIFSEVVVLDEVDSTNRFALDEARPGLVVRALRQWAGRGRRGRTWYSPGQDNLYITFTLAPIIPQYPIIAGVAAHDTLAEFLPGSALFIKWPNDILAENRKICGILCESRSGIAAVGVGINVNQDQWPDELKDTAVSMRQLAGVRFSVDDVAMRLANHLAGWICLYRKEGFDPVRRAFLERVTMEGIRLPGLEGVPCTLRDMTDDGYLVIDAGGTTRIIMDTDVWAD